MYIYIYQGLTRQYPGPSKLLQYHARQPPQTPAKRLQDPIPRQPQGPIQAQYALYLSLADMGDGDGGNGGGLQAVRGSPQAKGLLTCKVPLLYIEVVSSGWYCWWW